VETSCTQTSSECGPSFETVTGMPPESEVSVTESTVSSRRSSTVARTLWRAASMNASPSVVEVRYCRASASRSMVSSRSGSRLSSGSIEASVSIRLLACLSEAT